MGDGAKIEQRTSAKSFLRGLAAATCLTAATAGVAHATTTDEGVNDFGNDFATRTQLSVGTDVVTGFSSFLDSDFFEFSGLLGGGAFEITVSPFPQPVFGEVSARTGSDTPLGTPPFINFSSLDPHITGTTPSDGKIVVAITPFAEGGGPYTISLSAPLALVPGPASGLLTGLGAAALALRWARRRKLNH